jgi:demethylmenaquinone methyltransferase / 2-methoxy-6-polyprenyl-1,4-benzoquinol methylase
LEQVIPVYDKVNKYISLGSSTRLRSEGLDILTKAVGREDFSILDLGSGPGNMTKMLSSMKRSKQELSLMLDALIPMMRVAKSRNPASDCVVSTFENLSVREEVFEAAMSAFAIRDARELSVALKEIGRTLKKSGYFLMVDLCKPDSTVKRALVGLYWRTLAPFIALLASGRLGLKFAALSQTYRRLPRTSRFIRLVEKCGFKIETRKYSMLDGACILLMQKT